MTNCISINLPNIMAGIVASFVFLFCNSIFYWIKWYYNSLKFCGIWEQYEFNDGSTIYSICKPDQIKGTLISRNFLNPKKLIAKTVTFENQYYRFWEAKYEFINSNYCSGEYKYLPDIEKQQWGTHELRTQKRNEGTYILLTVKDGGSRGFSSSGQLLKKVSKNSDKKQYYLIKNKICKQRF